MIVAIAMICMPKLSNERNTKLPIQDASIENVKTSDSQQKDILPFNDAEDQAKFELENIKKFNSKLDNSESIKIYNAKTYFDQKHLEQLSYDQALKESLLSPEQKKEQAMVRIKDSLIEQLKANTLKKK